MSAHPGLFSNQRKQKHFFFTRIDLQNVEFIYDYVTTSKYQRGTNTLAKFQSPKGLRTDRFSAYCDK